MTADAAAPPATVAKAPPDPRMAAIGLLACAFALLLSLFLHWVKGAQGGIGLTGVEACLGDACQEIAWDKWKLGGDVHGFATLSLITGMVAILVAAAYGGLTLASLGAKLPSARVAFWVFPVTGFAMGYFAIRVVTDSPGSLGPGFAMLMAFAGVVGGGVSMRRLAVALTATQTTTWAPTPTVSTASPNPMFAPSVATPTRPSVPKFDPPAAAAPQLGAQPAATPPSKPVAPPPRAKAASQQPFAAGTSTGSEPPFAAGSTSGSQPPFSAQPPQASHLRVVPAQPQQAPSTAKCPRCASGLTFVTQYQRWFCERCRQYA